MGTGSNTVACSSCTYGETEDYRIVIVPCPAPSITVTPTSASVCPGNTVAFTGSGATNYTWTGGITNGVAFTPTASAIYTVSGSYTSGCVGTGTAELLVYPPISVSASTTNICSGSSVSLAATNGTGFVWSTSQNTTNIVVSPSTTTGYSVTGTTPQGCNSQTAITVTVASTPPALTFTNSSSSNGNGVCLSKSVTLTGSGTAPSTVSWSGGVTNGVPFAPANSATYVLTGVNVCGTSSVATSVSIHPQPNLTLTASQPTVCTTQSISLCPSGGVSYTMSPVTPTCSAYYPFSSQTFTVRGTSALGCTNSAVTSITVVTTPVIPPVVTPTLICVGSSATLGATGASNYSWVPFSPAITTNSTVVSPTVSTTYTLIKWNANCYNTDSVRLIVNDRPIIFAITNPTVVCASTPATLQAGGGISYSWSPGNLPSGTGASSIVVLPAQNTIYTVSASDGTCVGTSTVAVATNPNPTITINTSTNAICIGQSVTYTIAGASTYTYGNNPPTSPAITNTAGSISPTTTTNYQVSGVNQHGCSSSSSKLISVSALPPITITRTPTLVCVGYPSTLTASGVSTNTVHLFNWAHGGNSNKSVVNPQTTSVYTVTGTNTITSCQNSQTVSVAVYEPTFATTPDTAICRGGAITLTATGASSYTWTGGPATSSGVPFYNVSPTVMTVYSVTAKSTTLTLQCYSAKTISVDIFLQPTVSATPSRTQAICNKESVTLFGHGAHTYYWPTINQYGDSVIVSPTAQTKYRVIGTDQFGCKDTFDLLVKFSYCPGFEEYATDHQISVYPNPNNGFFTVETPYDVSLKLYNQLGQVVKEIKAEQKKPADINVKELPPGVYFLSGSHDGLKITQKIIIE